MVQVNEKVDEFAQVSKLFSSERLREKESFNNIFLLKPDGAAE